jgi:hypothetical protein
LRLEGKITDFGDLIHQERWIVKGRRYLWRWKIGPVDQVTVTSTRVATFSHSPTGRADVVMDLRADQKVTLSGQWTDEVGNPVPTPDGATVVFTVDNVDVITLTVTGTDGVAVVAAATGTLGTANVHAVANAPGMPELTGDLQIVVVAGLAERFNIVAGEPEEITPDGEPTPPTT